MALMVTRHMAELDDWSGLRRNFVIGSLSGPNFSIWTAKMDHS